MTVLDELNIRDLRPKLAMVKSNSRRPRRLPVNGATIHYNGPALSFFPNPERELRFVIETDVREHQKRLGADSLQYHFVVLSDGSIWQTRDLDLIAWHCGNITGNEQSIAIHLPLGKGQEPQPEQWASVVRLLDGLRLDYGFARSAVVGHNEWPRGKGEARPNSIYVVLPKQSECPGPLVHCLVAAYRLIDQNQVAEPPKKDKDTKHKKTTETWVALWKIPVRLAPRTHYEDGREVPITGWLMVGDEFEVDFIQADGDAQEIKGDRRWLHLASGLGFTWIRNARKKNN